MATKTFSIADFSLESRWSVTTETHWDGDEYYVYGTPSTATTTKTLDLSTIPAGSRITSATFAAKTNGAGDSAAKANDISKNITNDKTGANAPSVADWLSGMSGGTFGSLSIQFSFKAYGGRPTGSATSTFKNMLLTVNYELPNSTGTLNKNTVNAGDTITMTITPSNQSYSHKIKWAFGSHVEYFTLAAGTLTKTWTIPMSYLNDIPNAASGTAYVRLFTYNGSIEMGSSGYQFTVTTPSSVVPTAGTFTATPTADSIPSGWESTFVQGYSKASMSLANVAGAYGSTITSVRFSGWGNTALGTVSGCTYSATSAVLPTSGAVTLKALITDSRGRTTEVTKSITVVAYTRPVINSITAKRCLSDLTMDDTGTYVRLVVTYTIASVNNMNSLASSTTHYKEAAHTSYTNANVSFTNNTAVAVGGGNISADKAYNIKATITDTAGNSASAVVTVPTATYVLHFRDGGNAIGIGQAASSTNNSLTINPSWATYIGGSNISKACTHMIYQGEITTGDLDTYTGYGYYTIHSSSLSSISNVPANVAGALIVMSSCDDEKSSSVTPSAAWWSAMQVYLTVDGSGIYVRYIRTTSTAGSVTCGAWKKLATDDQLSANSIQGTLPIAHGGTGQTTEAGAKTTLGSAIGTGVFTFNAPVCFPGIITSSNTEARFTINLGRQILATNVTASGEGYIHTSAGKITGTNGSLTALSAMGTGVSATVNSNGYVTLVITGTFSGTNNAVAVLHMDSLTLTFT